jgi:site-specific DNA recombinase
MKTAVIYTRVSSREQEREGYSIPAQEKLLRKYAEQNGFRIIREFTDVETAKTTGRKAFGEMMRFFVENPVCRTVLVEKTDRLYRNFRDSISFEDLNVEIHLVKENQVISKDAKSQARLIHGFHVLLARNYSENLREEVKKGMREKAEQGIFPGKAPFGYRNNRESRSVEVEPKRAVVVKRMFELYGTGTYSLSSLQTFVRREYGIKINRAYLEKLLKSRFYIGYFIWQGIEYKGTHKPIIEASAFQRVQAAFASHNKPKYKKHEFAFAGLLTCAHDGCTVTTEMQKGKYIYYRCSHGRGKCSLPYVREEVLADQLAGVLKGIHIPDDALAQLVRSFDQDRAGGELKRRQALGTLKQRLSEIRERLDRAYEDKLDCKIDEAFWDRKSREYREQELHVQAQIEQLEKADLRHQALDAKRIFELANKACFLYLKQPSAEKGKLLKSVLLNCTTDGVSLTPTYRKPFNLIFQRAKNEEWSGRADLNCRPLAPQASALPG